MPPRTTCPVPRVPRSRVPRPTRPVTQARPRRTARRPPPTSASAPARLQGRRAGSRARAGPRVLLVPADRPRLLHRADPDRAQAGVAVRAARGPPVRRHRPPPPHRAVGDLPAAARRGRSTRAGSAAAPRQPDEDGRRDRGRAPGRPRRGVGAARRAAAARGRRRGGLCAAVGEKEAVTPRPATQSGRAGDARPRLRRTPVADRRVDPSCRSRRPSRAHEAAADPAGWAIDGAGTGDPGPGRERGPCRERPAPEPGAVPARRQRQRRQRTDHRPTGGKQAPSRQPRPRRPRPDAATSRTRRPTSPSPGRRSEQPEEPDPGVPQ